MRKLVLAGLFLAMGLVLPLGFHAAGLGPSFLPMHIPVLFAGLYLGWRWGIAVGAALPLLSGLLTGMPPFAPPVAFTMMFELPAYAVAAAVLYRWMRPRAVLPVAGALVVGRIMYGLVGYLFFPLLGLPRASVLYPVTAGLVAGLPGIAVQMVLVPAVLARFRPSGSR